MQVAGCGSAESCDLSGVIDAEPEEEKKRSSTGHQRIEIVHLSGLPKVGPTHEAGTGRIAIWVVDARHPDYLAPIVDGPQSSGWYGAQILLEQAQVHHASGRSPEKRVQSRSRIGPANHIPEVVQPRANIERAASRRAETAQIPWHAVLPQDRVGAEGERKARCVIAGSRGSRHLAQVVDRQREPDRVAADRRKRVNFSGGRTPDRRFIPELLAGLNTGILL